MVFRIGDRAAAAIRAGADPGRDNYGTFAEGLRYDQRP